MHVKQKVFRVTIAVLSCLVSTVVMAQLPQMNFSGDREGVFITAGGPSLEQAKRQILDMIDKQSEGRIVLGKIMPTKARFTNFEIDGKAFVQFGFEAQIEFSEPCKWSTRYNGHSLSFKTFNASVFDPKLLGRNIVVSEKGARYTVFGYILFRYNTNNWEACGFGCSAEPKESAGVTDAGCMENMKRIGLAFRLWSGDNGDHYPFNVSTNSGGTKELCELDSEGFDKNTPIHFLVMTNELSTPEILVCPDDASKLKLKYTEFQKLTWDNVSYRLRTGVSVDESNPQEVLAVCPIHGFLILCDGSVQKRRVK